MSITRTPTTRPATRRVDRTRDAHEHGRHDALRLLAVERTALPWFDGANMSSMTVSAIRHLLPIFAAGIRPAAHRRMIVAGVSFVRSATSSVVR